MGDNNDDVEQIFHRVNKNRPREMSSKKPVSQFRDVFQVKRKHLRDPRFDDLSGEFNEAKFEESYEFIKDIRSKEKEELKKMLGKATNDNRKRKIKLLLQRMANQEKSVKMKSEAHQKAKQERDSRIQDLQEGKQPYFIKKSEARQTELIDTYQQLKKSGKLEKYMEKKRKKQVFKDRKRLWPQK